MRNIENAVEREAMRLSALYSLGVHGGERFVIFDRLVNLATDFFGVPMAVIALIDEDRQIFFAKTGITADSTSRADSICTHTVAEDRMMVIRDLSIDLRWCDRSFRTDGMPLRFYAGTPIHVDGQPIGTFCLLDHQPRPYFDESDERLLISLALIAEDLMTVLKLRRDFEKMQGRETALPAQDDAREPLSAMLKAHACGCPSA